MFQELHPVIVGLVALTNIMSLIEAELGVIIHTVGD